MYQIHIKFRVWWNAHKERVYVPLFLVALALIFYTWQPLVFERPMFPHIDKLLHFIVALGIGALLVRIGTTTRLMRGLSWKEEVLLVVLLVFFASMVWEAGELAYGAKPNNAESSLDIAASILGAYGGALWGRSGRNKKGEAAPSL